MTPPVERRRAEPRGRLLDAAAKLITERGWSGVSTRILAERAEVSPSVVHYHFDSVPALLSEAALGAMRGVLAEAAEAMRGYTRPTEAIDALLDSVRHFDGTDPMSVLAIEAYLAAGRDERLRADIRELLGEFTEQLAQLLDAASVPRPEDTARVLAATIDGLLMHRGITGHTENPPAEVLYRLINSSEGNAP